jgi:hypothetical protein
MRSIDSRRVVIVSKSPQMFLPQAVRHAAEETTSNYIQLSLASFSC